MVQWGFSLQFLTYLRTTKAKTIHVGLVQPLAPFRPSLVCHRELLPPPAIRGTGQALFFTLSPFSQHPPTTLAILIYLFILLLLSGHRGGASRSAHQESCDYVPLSYLTQRCRLYQLISTDVYDIITCALQ